MKRLVWKNWTPLKFQTSKTWHSHTNTTFFGTQPVYKFLFFGHLVFFSTETRCPILTWSAQPPNGSEAPVYSKFICFIFDFFHREAFLKNIRTFSSKTSKFIYGFHIKNLRNKHFFLKFFDFLSNTKNKQTLLCFVTFRWFRFQQSKHFLSVVVVASKNGRINNVITLTKCLSLALPGSWGGEIWQD